MDDKPRILGVDDSLTIRKALELVLKPAGYTLELASSGTEAIDKARWFRPSAVLLDFILPDMRGTEVCRRLAADPETAGVPVILISAKGAEIRQAYHDVGNVVAYVAKPFTPEAILEVIADVVARAARGELAMPSVEPPAIAPHASGNGAAEVAILSPAFAESIRTETIAADSYEPVRAEAPARPASNGAANGASHDAWDDADLDEASAGAQDDAVEERRESLETMLEALNAGLEGVYVEEVDTSTGAAADEAKTYTDLVAQLTRQLGEALAQARSGARFALCGDGSVRSLDDVLFDAYRRICRLLFRAAADGAVGRNAPGGTRVLVVCHRDSPLFGGLGAALEARKGGQVFLVAERFRQLPMLTRLYGPTHVLVDLGGSAAIWDQLGAVAAMPERQRMSFVGIAPPRSSDSPVEARARTVVMDIVLESGPRLAADLERLLGTAAPPAADVYDVEPRDEAAAAAIG